MRPAQKGMGEMRGDSRSIRRAKGRWEPPPHPSPAAYLREYASEARYVIGVRELKGWAQGKHWARAAVHRSLRLWPGQPIARVDALLDSVN